MPLTRDVMGSPAGARLDNAPRAPDAWRALPPHPSPGSLNTTRWEHRPCTLPIAQTRRPSSPPPSRPPGGHHGGAPQTKKAQQPEDVSGTQHKSTDTSGLGHTTACSAQWGRGFEILEIHEYRGARVLRRVSFLPRSEPACSRFRGMRPDRGTKHANQTRAPEQGEKLNEACYCVVGEICNNTG